MGEMALRRRPWTPPSHHRFRRDTYVASGTGRKSMAFPRSAGMPTPITASMLYDLVACPHRVTMDLFGDPVERDPTRGDYRLPLAGILQRAAIRSARMS